MIRSRVEGRVGVITLARPEKRNALTPEMLVELESTVERLGGVGEVGALLLAGEGPAFCAGFDLTRCRDHPDGSVMRALLTGLWGVIGALRAQPRPVVVAAHGAAVAGGCALLGGADFVLTNDGARLGYPVLRLGVSPAVSGPFLRHRVGDGRSRELMLHGGPGGLVTGAEAARVGLATWSLPTAEEVSPAALALAGELAAKPAEAMAATRAWMAEVEGPTASRAALEVSLGLTGGEEERRLLPQAWAARA